MLVTTLHLPSMNGELILFTQNVVSIINELRNYNTNYEVFIK